MKNIPKHAMIIKIPNGNVAFLNSSLQLLHLFTFSVEMPEAIKKIHNVCIFIFQKILNK